MQAPAPFSYPYPMAAAWQASSASITIGGTTYSFDQSKTPMDVTLFDTNSPFGILMDPSMKGHYGIGLIETMNISDGAGFIADYTGETNPADHGEEHRSDGLHELQRHGFCFGCRK